MQYPLLIPGKIRVKLLMFSGFNNSDMNKNAQMCSKFYSFIYLEVKITLQTGIFTRISCIKSCIFTRVNCIKLCIFTRISTIKLCIVTRINCIKLRIFTRINCIKLCIFTRISCVKLWGAYKGGCANWDEYGTLSSKPYLIACCI